MNLPARLGLLVSLLTATLRAAVPVDLSGLAAASELKVTPTAGTDLVVVEWPATPSGARASLTLNLAPDRPLFDRLGWQPTPDAPFAAIAEKLTPLTVLTVGERDLSRNGWMVFFDKVQTRPSQRFPAKLKPTALKVTSTATRRTAGTGFSKRTPAVSYGAAVEAHRRLA